MTVNGRWWAIGKRRDPEVAAILLLHRRDVDHAHLEILRFRIDRRRVGYGRIDLIDLLFQPLIDTAKRGRIAAAAAASCRISSLPRSCL